MGNHGRIDSEKLISYGNDLVDVLKKNKDVNNLVQCLEGAKMLQTSSQADFSDTRNLLEEYEKKISSCKQRIDEIKHEVVTDTELEHLENELQEELQKERLLQEELRIVNNQISELEYQRISIEERKKILKKAEKDELMAQKKLQMLASVTNTIPHLHDETNISGHIVDKDKRMVEKFEFVPTNASSFEICNSLWEMIVM